MSRSIAQFKFLLNKADRVSDDCWNVTTAKRKTLIVPTGFKLFDTDLKILFLGDGVTYGGIPVDGKESGRTIVTDTADGFESSDTFITVTGADEDGVFITSADHGLSVGTKIIPMADDSTYEVEQDTVYTVATVPDANTFTLTGVTPEDRTANLVVKVYNIANNNYVTWDQAAYLRTGDAVTVAAGGGTLPSGLTTTETYYIVKDDSAENGGLEKNTTTKFRFSDSRAHALAGTHIVTIRDAGTTGFTAAIAKVYLTNADKTVFASFGAAADIYLPDGEKAGLGKSFEINNSGTADCTVKSEGGAVMGADATDGKVLKTNDFIVVKSDGTDWCAFGAQITPTTP
jgi:hypothetical protein